MGWIPSPVGLGWNAEGKPLAERMAFVQELWDKLTAEKDIRVRHYQRRSGRMNRMIYDHPEWTRGLHLEPSADQADFDVFFKKFPISYDHQLLQLMFESWTLFLPNLDYLARSPDVGSLAGKEVSDLLSRYSWIERLSKMSQLTILERTLDLGR